MEVLSETNFGMHPAQEPFRANSYVDVSDYMDDKLTIMALYEDEMGEFPFPRSEAAIRAQAALRGSEAGCDAAEAFMIMREYR